jgi:hypothetical protein
MPDELLINRVNQVEISSTAIEAARTADGTGLGWGYSLAPQFGPFRTATDDADTGGVGVGFVPTSWGLVSISMLISSFGDYTGDLTLQAGKLGVAPEAQFTIEDFGDLMGASPTYEVELLSSLAPYAYSEDMSGAPFLWGRKGTTDTIESDILVVGFTFRRVD